MWRFYNKFILNTHSQKYIDVENYKISENSTFIYKTENNTVQSQYLTKK